MESNVVLQSRDILHYRRDRLLCPNPNCDRNQALLLNLPCVLRRLVQLLRVMNHAPPIHELAAARHGGGNQGGGEAQPQQQQQQPQQQQQQPQPPGQPAHPPAPGQGQAAMARQRRERRRRPHELFLLLAEMVEQNDWGRVDRLEAMVAAAPARARGRAHRGGSRRALSPAQLLALMQPILLARVRARFASPDEVEVGRVLQLVHHMADPADDDGDDDDAGGAAAPGQGSGGGGWGGFFRRATGVASGGSGGGSPPLSITVAEARTELEFYGVSLTAFQTEVLFVLCSLLGGRRKISFQDSMVGEMGLLEALTAMFPRLSWGKRARHLHHAAAPPGGVEGQPIFVNMETGEVVGLEALAGLPRVNWEAMDMVDNVGDDLDYASSDYQEAPRGSDDEEGSEDWNGSDTQEGDDEDEDEDGEDEEEDGEPTRIHGEHCNCQPDSALRIQYLRLLHNALDRDDAGAFPHLKSRALGSGEREALLRGDTEGALQAAARAARGEEAKGVVALVLEALGKEAKDSAVRFWLSSSLEAFLRGAGPSAQAHVARAHPGLIGERLLGQEVLAEGLEVVPGLKQSAFDLLGELTRSHPWMLAQVEAGVEGKDGRLEAAILHNLVDSNVFLRSVLMTLYVEDRELEEGEDLSAGVGRLALGEADERNEQDDEGFSYLRQTWTRPTMARASALVAAEAASDEGNDDDDDDLLLRRSREQQAWRRRERERLAVRPGTPAARELNGRLHAFVRDNWTLLLQKLMAAVDFSAVNHESLCVLNSALLMLLLSYRQGRLAQVVAELKALHKAGLEQADEQPKTYFSWSLPPPSPPSSGRTGGPEGEEADDDGDGGPPEAIQHADFLGNFRALLFFWREYYSARGRDRLSIEFSSRIPFAEWRAVLDALCADDGSPTALLPAPLRLPKSPYALPPRAPVLRCAV